MLRLEASFPADAEIEPDLLPFRLFHVHAKPSVITTAIEPAALSSLPAVRSSASGEEPRGTPPPPPVLTEMVLDFQVGL